jgi:hypothetical protein
MLNWYFTLNPDIDDLLIEEPVGWSDIEFNASRDITTHGISVLFSVSDLTFDGAAAQFIRDKYKQFGVDASVEMLVQAFCDDDDVADYEETFKFDFAQLSDKCGDECTLSIGIEQKSCLAQFNRSYDQKVNIDAVKTFDQTTDIVPHVTSMPMPAKAIMKQIDGSVVDEGFTVTQPVDVLGSIHFQVRPDYGVQRMNSIKTGELSSMFLSYLDEPGYDDAISPQLLMEDLLQCLTEGIHVTGKLKGTVASSYAATHVDVRVWLYTQLWGDLTTQVFLSNTTIYSGATSAGQEIPFDIDVDFPDVNIPDGQGLWFVVDIQTTNDLILKRFIVNFDKETFITIDAISKCPPTNADVHFLHETLDHIVQSITDKCLKLKSDYYGRIDLGYLNDGCGSLRVLTSGLKIRNAQPRTFFLSMQDAIKNLNAIDNIGFAIEKDENDNDVLRIESINHFYQSREILKFEGVQLITTKIASNELYNVVKIGYEKWEAESINSLDELNSNREYRPSMTNVSGTKDLLCRFIAGGYPIELCRIQNFVNTGAQDSKFDNETFIICIRRTSCANLPGGVSFSTSGGANQFSVPANTPNVVVGNVITFEGTQFNAGPFTIESVVDFFGGWLVTVTEPVVNEIITNQIVKLCGDIINDDQFEVEQDNAINEDHLFDPDSLYNFRISPVRNLMRHFKSLGGIFPDYLLHKLIFISGTGNVDAEGEQESPICKIESHIISEKQDITSLDFASPSDARPIFRPEPVTFEFPLSIAQFKNLRANPYGYISYRCNSTDKFKKGFLFNLKYRIANGTASFELRNKY